MLLKHWAPGLSIMNFILFKTQNHVKYFEDILFSMTRIRYENDSGFLCIILVLFIKLLQN